MGISLNGLTPAGTYPGLIKTGDNTAIDGTLKALSDGNGNNLPMEVSTTGVNLTGSPTVNAVAIANTTQVAAKQDTLVSGTNIKTINGTSVLGSGNIVTPSTPPSGVAGAIQFSAGSAFNSDAANLFWDDTNNRLGVGTNAPSVKYDQQGGGALFNMGGGGTNSFRVQRNGFTLLNIGTDNASIYMTADGGNNGNIQFVKPNGSLLMQISDTGTVATIKGSGSTSATTSLLVQNSAGTATLTARDDGKILIRDYISGVGENAYLRLNNSNGFEGGYNEGSGGSFQAGGSTVNLNIGSTKILQGYSGGISIGKGASNPVASAQLEVFSTTKGFLMPRMTTTEINAIASPANGLEVYNTTLNCPCFYNGTSWRQVTNSAM